jgi:hypothetical protein
MERALAFSQSAVFVFEDEAVRLDPSASIIKLAIAKLPASELAGP